MVQDNKCHFISFVKELFFSQLSALGMACAEVHPCGIKFESASTELHFSYDYPKSYEIDITISLKLTNTVLSYSLIKNLMSGHSNTSIAVQIVDKESLRRWLIQEKDQILSFFYAVYCNEINQKRISDIWRDAVEMYNQSNRYKVEYEKIDALWQKKDYGKIIEIFDEFPALAVGSYALKYEYARKKMNINK